MSLHSISIETLKETLDSKTLHEIFEVEAKKKSLSFKYIMNIVSSNKNKKGNKYCQLKGTIGYDKDGKKLWVSKSLGKVVDVSSLDEQEIRLKHDTFMKNKAKDCILNEFLK
jgi:hypothetical protein